MALPTSEKLRNLGPWWVVLAVVVVMVFVAGLFAGKFWWSVPGSELSSKADDWGTFGDYFGGLLNPVVALAALMLLAWSIRLQKRELAETREALVAQAHSSQQLVQLNALAVMIESKNYQVAHLDAILARHRRLLAACSDEQTDDRNFQHSNIKHFERQQERVRSEQLSYVKRAKTLMDQIAPAGDGNT